MQIAAQLLVDEFQRLGDTVMNLAFFSLLFSGRLESNCRSRFAGSVGMFVEDVFRCVMLTLFCLLVLPRSDFLFVHISSVLKL